MSECKLRNTGPETLKEKTYKKIKDSYVLDIGGNQGIMSEIFLQNKAKHVLIIEPNKVLCQKIKTKLVPNFEKSRFTILNCGISNKKELLRDITFVNCWTLGTPASTNLDISPGAQEIVGKEKFNVNLISLDELMVSGLFSKVKNNNIKFIKIDVDGYEIKVLKGAKNFINKYRPTILFELSYLPVNCGDNIYEMLDIIFDDLNYKMYRTDGLEISKQFAIDNFPWHTSCDVILSPNN